MNRVVNPPQEWHKQAEKALRIRVQELEKQNKELKSRLVRELLQEPQTVDEIRVQTTEALAKAWNERTDRLMYKSLMEGADDSR